MDIRRRSALVFVVAIANAPRALAARIFRIGVLGVSDWDPTGPFDRPFVDELARRGYVQGRNLVLVSRSCGPELTCLDALAAELVALKVDLILSNGGTPTALAAKRATSKIPIVMTGARDPVSDGLVKSLGRPGGNVTGNADMGAVLMVKRLQLLMEAVGSPAVVGYLGYEPHMKRISERETVAALESFLQAKGRRLVVATVRERGDDLEAAFASLRQKGAAAVLVNNYATIGADSAEQVAGWMMRYRLPSIMEERSFAVSGVLATYSEPGEHQAVRAAEYVDRILKGALPSDLPVSQGTTFDLVLNLKTAKAMGLTIPRYVLLRASELIQ